MTEEQKKYDKEARRVTRLLLKRPSLKSLEDEKHNLLNKLKEIT